MAFENIVITDQGIFDLEENLGYYAFDEMLGMFMPKQEQFEITRRRGHPGESFRESGVCAEESQITTILGCENRTEAIAALNAFIALKTGEPFEFWQHGESYGFFRVVDVKMSQPIPISSAIGYIHPTPTVEAAYYWRIISTTPPPPDPGP